MAKGVAILSINFLKKTVMVVQIWQKFQMWFGNVFFYFYTFLPLVGG